MLHLIFWIVQTSIILFINLITFSVSLFLVTSLNSIYLKINTPFSVLCYFLTFLFVYALIPLQILILVLISGTILAYFNMPLNSFQASFWTLIVINLETIISLREYIFISDSSNKALLLALNIGAAFLSSLFFILFASEATASILLVISFSVITFSLLGASISLLLNLLSPAQTPLSPNYSAPGMPPASSFANFLTINSNSHPLNAMAEESFYEENLQIGDFYITFPIFFNASAPKSFPLSTELEIANIWHTIRWESAFSNQLGSGASRWSSIPHLNSTSIPDSAHSIHIPLIPVFNNDLYNELKAYNLLTIDPFSQPPEWSPYQILVNSLGWLDEEKNEERLNEIDEED